MIKLIASDLDGTILKNGAQELPEGFLDLVENLYAHGVHFVAASGRQYVNLHRLFAPVADKISFICENGCLVMEQEKVLRKAYIDRELGLQLMAEILDFPNGELLLSGERTSYIIPKTQEYHDILKYQVKNHVTCIQSPQEVEEEYMKISMLINEATYGQGDVPAEVQQRFHRDYDSQLNVMTAGHGWLDFIPQDAGKGPALKKIMEMRGIGPEEIMVFGDNENDISMLQLTKNSYAMDTALPHVQAQATYVCSDVPQVILEKVVSQFH